MKLIYSKYNGSPQSKEERFEKLLSLFNYLMLQTNGDVDEALDWMDQLDEKYGFFDKDFTKEEFIKMLKEKGYIGEEEEGNMVLTPSGSVQLRQDCFKEIFGNLKKSSIGFHESVHTGTGVERDSTTRKYKFGDHAVNIDPGRTISNVYKRDGLDGFNLNEEDIEVYETEHQTNCSTVLLIDISHSMILYGEDRITPAKQVALALSELILSKYKKDSLNIILFGDDAKEVKVSDLPFVSVGPFHTNTKAGLTMARHILNRQKNVNKMIFMITDGKPSAIFENDGRLYKNSFGLDTKIVNQTMDEAIKCRKEKIKITTFMIADDPYLVRFIKDFTAACDGKAYYSSLNDLGQHIFNDYFRNRTSRSGSEY